MWILYTYKVTDGLVIVSFYKTLILFLILLVCYFCWLSEHAQYSYNKGRQCHRYLRAYTSNFLSSNFPSLNVSELQKKENFTRQD